MGIEETMAKGLVEGVVATFSLRRVRLQVVVVLCCCSIVI